MTQRPPVRTAGDCWPDSAAMRWYQAGLERGIELGRQQVLDEWHQRAAVSAAIAALIANTPNYADLAEQRGEHVRAERQRQILRDRGIRP